MQVVVSPVLQVVRAEPLSKVFCLCLVILKSTVCCKQVAASSAAQGIRQECLANGWPDLVGWLTGPAELAGLAGWLAGAADWLTGQAGWLAGLCGWPAWPCWLAGLAELTGWLIGLAG